jgi:hypothetical protein
MIDKNAYIHDLAMLRLKSETISGLTNDQLMSRYLSTVSELKDADDKFRKEHYKAYGGVKVV